MPLGHDYFYVLVDTGMMSTREDEVWLLLVPQCIVWDSLQTDEASLSLQIGLHQLL